MSPDDMVAEFVADAALPPAPTAPAGVGQPAAPALPEKPPNKVFAWAKRQWGKVTATTSKRPEQFRGRRLARMVNEELDGRDGKIHGPAHRTQLGESVSLVVENLVHGGDATTPLGFLTGASLEYAWTVWDEAPADVQATFCQHGGPPATCPQCSKPPAATPVFKPATPPEAPPPTPVADPGPPPAPAAAAPISPKRRARARRKKA